MPSDKFTREDLSAVDNQLLDACRAGKLARVREALKAGANPNANRGGSAVCWAATLESPECLKALLRAGADASGGGAGAPALWNAGRFMREKTLRVLLEAGVNPNQSVWRVRGTGGHTVGALKNPKMIADLLEFGWDPRVEGPEGKTPLEMAKEYKLKEVQVILEQAAERMGLEDAALNGESRPMTRSI